MLLRYVSKKHLYQAFCDIYVYVNDHSFLIFTNSVTFMQFSSRYKTPPANALSEH